MHTTPKLRTLLLLVAVLFTVMVSSFPEPAAACWIAWGTYCSYPNGVVCRYSPCTNRTTCSGMPDGSPSCFEEEYCCP